MSRAALLGLLLVTQSAAAGPRPDPAAALKRYYAGEVTPPPWDEPLRSLASGTVPERFSAAAYLRALADRSLADERSGDAPWRATPYWGGRPENPARQLRNAIVHSLKATPRAEAEPVLRWFLERESDDRLSATAAEALDKLDGPDVAALRAEVIAKPHPNAVVLAVALKQAAERKQTVPTASVAALCYHHRGPIREAARVLHAQLGGPDHGPFDPVKAVRSAPVAKLMADVTALMPELPAADARLVSVTVRYLDDKQTERRKHVTRGWFAGRDGDIVRVYTPHGRVFAVREKEKTHVGEPVEHPNGGVSFRDIDVVTEVTVADLDPAELADAVAAARKKGEAGMVLAEQGELSGQFRGSGATLYEVLLGAWLYRAGKDDPAARVLLPAIESVYRDEHLADVARHGLGELAGQRMLVAFVGDRDYPAALRHAKLVDTLYPDTRFHQYAKDLLAQLPRRADDFTTRRLPTPAEWEKLRPTLTRDHQIDYLCARLRLLNAYQMDQPGGVDIEQPQFAEPQGLGGDASWGGGTGGTPVIHPLLELVGAEASHFHPGPPWPPGLGLTLADVPRLAAHLRDDWYILAVEFWRSFHPDRHLLGTRPLLAGIIDRLARRRLCRVHDWQKLTPAEVDREIDRIAAWARENAGKSDVELDRATVAELAAAGAAWYEVQDHVSHLLRAGDTVVFDVMRRYLQDSKPGDYSRETILRMYGEYGPDRAKDLAPAYLADRWEEVRLAAAVVALRAGDKAAARPILGAALEQHGLTSRTEPAALALAADGTPESLREAARLFRTDLRQEREGLRRRVLAAYAKAGMAEPYRFYLDALSVPKSATELIIGGGPTVAEVLVWEVINHIAADDPEVKAIAAKHPNPADRIGPVRDWLRARLAEKK
jgi:hypothetical protein